MARLETMPLVRGARAYRVFDLGGWLVLIVLASIFLATGFSIREALRQSHPVIADLVLVGASFVALCWAILYYALRVSAHAVVSDEGFVLVHGFIRHQIDWNEVARLDEWTRLDEGFRSQWIALSSTTGMRLQLRQDLVPNYVAFRADVIDKLDAILAQPHSPPSMVSDLDTPIWFEEEVDNALSAWGVTLAITLFGGTSIVAFLHPIVWVGYALLTLAVIAGCGIALTYLLRQHLVVQPDGIQAWRGPARVALPWESLYNVDRERGEKPSLRAALGRIILVLILQVDRRSGVIPAAGRSYGVITIHGGSGQRIQIRERHYAHPSWIRARLRLEIERLRQSAAPIAPSVAPLPPTGPLAAGTVLPPDPTDGSSALWLRESGAYDPFRNQH